MILILRVDVSHPLFVSPHPGRCGGCLADALILHNIGEISLLKNSKKGDYYEMKQGLSVSGVICRGQFLSAAVAREQYENVTHAYHMDASILHSDEGRSQLR